MTRYITLAEYFWLAEQVTGVDAGTLSKVSRVELAESALHAPQASFGGEEFYPDLVDKAAVLTCRLAWNHPLLDGNMRAAWASLLLFVDLNVTWVATSLSKASRALFGGRVDGSNQPAYIVEVSGCFTAPTGPLTRLRRTKTATLRASSCNDAGYLYTVAILLLVDRPPLPLRRVGLGLQRRWLGLSQFGQPETDNLAGLKPGPVPAIRT